MPATIVQKATRTVAPGAMRTRRRKAKIGSSTVPTVFERARPSITAIGVRMPWPRPRKRALSVSISGLPTTWPSTTARCAAQISCSVGARRRRVAKIAPTSGDKFGLDKQLRKGRMRDIGGLRRQRQFGVGRDFDFPGTPPVFEIEMRRTSASSSAETSTSSVVVNVPSRRVNSARSSLKATS